MTHHEMRGLTQKVAQKLSLPFCPFGLGVKMPLFGGAFIFLLTSPRPEQAWQQARPYPYHQLRQEAFLYWTRPLGRVFFRLSHP
jgi:hypothetical protein